MLEHLDDFLEELVQADRSRHTIRAYRQDLSEFAGELTVADLRAHFAKLAHLAPATRARKQAAMSAYCRWAVRNELLPYNPIERLDRVQVEPPLPRGISREQFRKILVQVKSPRDRLLFRMMFETGIRIDEALHIHIEDLDLRQDDEHLTVIGKGKKRRTILLDDPTLVRDLRSYLKRTAYKHGMLFRAEKNGTGAALRYQTVQERWARYCAAAGATCTLHQLRHGHATELANDNVSLATIRKRLGHRHIQTTLRYAEISDQAAEKELRARHRKLGHQ